MPIYGPFQIRWYGLMFLFVFWGGYLLLAWQFKRAGRDRELASRFVNWAIAGVLLGSWFIHRFFYEWHHIIENPLYLIDISHGLSGLSSHGGTIGLLIAIFWFGRRYNIAWGEFCDRATFGAALSGVFVRTGNFFNSEIVGRPTDVDWAVCFPRYERIFTPPGLDPALIPRHPSQLYEVAAGLLLLGVLLWVDRLAGGEKRPRWLLSGIYLVIYFGNRFLIEYVKEYQTLTGGLTMGQWLSIPGILGGLFCLYLAFAKRLPASNLPSPAA